MMKDEIRTSIETASSKSETRLVARRSNPPAGRISNLSFHHSFVIQISDFVIP